MESCLILSVGYALLGYGIGTTLMLAWFVK